MVMCCVGIRDYTWVYVLCVGNVVYVGTGYLLHGPLLCSVWKIAQDQEGVLNDDLAPFHLVTFYLYSGVTI